MTGPGVPGQPGPPLWWRDLAPGWSKDDTVELLRLLNQAYPSPADLPGVPHIGDLGVPAELGNAIPAEDPWTMTLRHSLAERQIDQLLTTVLNDLREREPDGALARLLKKAAKPRSGLEKNTSGNGEPADGDDVIDAFIEMKLRTAVVEVNEHSTGSGCLIGDRLVLTCQHVVEESRGKVADPTAIRVRFDFNRRSGKTYAQTGQLVAVSGVISSSPPTDTERDPAPGSYRGADADHLDYALLELSAPAPPPPAQTQGGLAERGYYWTFDGPYRFGADEWLVLAHYPEGAFIRFNYVGGKPKFDYSKTRISYRCENTKPGSSGGPIVNAQGRLIALHQGVIVPEQGAAETAPDKRGIPISAIAEDLRRKELGDIVKPENVTRMGRRSYSRHAREQICRELSGDLSAVTRYLKVPGFIDDPDTLWDWLENHNRLPKLRCALEAADRADLVRILDADRVIVDRARMDQIDELAESILRSAAEAEQPGTFTVAMNRVRRLVESLELALPELPEFDGDDRTQLQWQVDWNVKLGAASTALGELWESLPARDAEPYQARRNTIRVLRLARKIRSAVDAMYDLAENPELAAQ